MPVDLQEEMTKLELGISQNEWDSYSHCTRVKIIASQIIKNRIELIRRIYDFLERNKQKATSK